MTQEEKQLLLQDLCARLPYGVKVKFYLPLNTHFVIEILRDVEIRNEDILICTTTWNAIKLEICKPYLRPMSSMTEEEKADLEAYSKQELDKYADDVLNGSDEDTIRYSQVSLIYKDIDWYNAHHIDYRGLIPMGLALEAPRDMYNTKTK